jgi:hypothetical protein
MRIGTVLLSFREMLVMCKGPEELGDFWFEMEED